MTEEQKQDKKLWFSAMIKYFRYEVSEIMRAVSIAKPEQLEELSHKLLDALSWKNSETNVYDTKNIYNPVIVTTNIVDGKEVTVKRIESPICSNFDGTLMEVANKDLWSHKWFTRACLVPQIILDLLRPEPYLEEGFNEDTKEDYSFTYQIQPGLVKRAKEYFNGWDNLTIEECQKKMYEVYGEAFSPEPIENVGGIFAWLEEKLSNNDIFI